MSHLTLAQAASPSLLSPEGVFGIANMLALLGWALLVFLPRSAVTQFVVHGGILPAILAVFYVSIVGSVMAQGGMRLSDFSTLEGVKGIFRSDWAVVAGWIHYITFDLMVGAWQVRDAHRVGLWIFVVIPCLALTFLFGPAGLLAYLLLRWSIFRDFKVE